jgi:hypothetical protein
MKTIVHPNFSKQFQKTLLFTWTGSVFCFGMGLFLLKNNAESVGKFFALAFVLIAMGGMGMLYYRLHHVICLDCGGQTQSVKDKETRSKWVANCQNCQIRWDLQIGVANS